MNARPKAEMVLEDDDDPVLAFTKPKPAPEPPAEQKKQRAVKPKASPEPAGPRYESFPRVEARLRYDQLTELAQLRRRVARNRSDRSERITDNTLIRIAVDVLVQLADELKGNNEEELRAAVLTALAEADLSGDRSD